MNIHLRKKHNMTKIKKEVELDENVFVLYNILLGLYERYRSGLPKHLSDTLYKAYQEFEKEYTKDYGNEDFDIVECRLVEKLVFDSAVRDSHLLNKK